MSQRITEGDSNVVVGGCYESQPFADEGLELTSRFLVEDENGIPRQLNHTNRSNEMEDIGFRCGRWGGR